jgi:4-amino-4-deoxy-L-arabinose transferase-like glycosyltransferase
MSPETFWLLAWCLGGLLVMSLVPSKRIDRIFPIVPPLCLLLAAVVSSLREKERWRSIVERCCAIALVLSMVFLSVYTVRKIATASRKKQDAFAVFGRAVVQKAAASQWRYGVVGGEDEGMLLYARRTEFLEPDEAAVGWNSGKLDALVVAEDELAGLLPRLRGGEPRQILTSNPAGRYRKRYFLLARPTSS